MKIKEFYKNKTIVKYSDDLIKLKDVSLKTSFIEPRCFNNPLKLVNLWFDERGFLFKNIPFISFDKLNNIINKSSDTIMQNVKYISPFYVPILYINERKDYGCFTPIYFEKNVNDYELVFTEIRLSNKKTIFIPLIYLHEIMHMVIENNDYTITNYADYELFPILFEFLFSNDLGSEIFHFNVSYRINQIRNYIDMLLQQDLLAKIYGSSYLISIVNAYELVSNYRNKNVIGKKEFLNDLKIVLNEKKDIYWMLEKYNINYYSALNKLIGNEKSYVKK